MRSSVNAPKPREPRDAASSSRPRSRSPPSEPASPPAGRRGGPGRSRPGPRRRSARTTSRPRAPSRPSAFTTRRGPTPRRSWTTRTPPRTRSRGRASTSGSSTAQPPQPAPQPAAQLAPPQLAPPQLAPPQPEPPQLDPPQLDPPQLEPPQLDPCGFWAPQLLHALLPQPTPQELPPVGSCVAFVSTLGSPFDVLPWSVGVGSVSCASNDERNAFARPAGITTRPRARRRGVPHGGFFRIMFPCLSCPLFMARHLRLSLRVQLEPRAARACSVGVSTGLCASACSACCWSATSWLERVRAAVCAATASSPEGTGGRASTEATYCCAIVWAVSLEGVPSRNCLDHCEATPCASSLVEVASSVTRAGLARMRGSSATFWA